MAGWASILSEINGEGSRAAIAAERTTGALALVLAWSVVGVPLLFGIVETLQNAIKLFRC
jgi:hypothetical protein